MKKIELTASVIFEDGEGDNKANVTNPPGAIVEVDNELADKLIAEGRAREVPPPLPEGTALAVFSDAQPE